MHHSHTYVKHNSNHDHTQTSAHSHPSMTHKQENPSLATRVSIFLSKEGLITFMTMASFIIVLAWILITFHVSIG